jgi:hypothetical protein
LDPTAFLRSVERGHVQEHGIFDKLISFAQPLGQGPQHVYRQAGTGDEELEEVLAVQNLRFGRLGGYHRGGTGLFVDEGQLAEEVTRIQYGQ